MAKRTDLARSHHTKKVIIWGDGGVGPIVAIILQYVYLSNHHLVYLTFVQCYGLITSPYSLGGGKKMLLWVFFFLEIKPPRRAEDVLILLPNTEKKWPSSRWWAGKRQTSLPSLDPGAFYTGHPYSSDAVHILIPPLSTIRWTWLGSLADSQAPRSAAADGWKKEHCPETQNCQRHGFRQVT